MSPNTLIQANSAKEADKAQKGDEAHGDGQLESAMTENTGSTAATGTCPIGEGSIGLRSV